MGWNPVKEAEKRAKKAIDKIINPAAESAKRAVEKVAGDAGWRARKSVENIGNEVGNGVKKVGDEVEDGIKTVAREVEDDIRKTGKEVEEGFTETLPELVEDVLEGIAEEASEDAIKKALDNAADVIEIMAPTSFTLIFGLELALVVQAEVTVSLTLPNPTAKLTEIRKWAAKPPEGRAQIMECIKDFGPDSLGVEAKVSGNGLAAEWDGEDKYDRVDAFLAKHGID